MEQLDLHITDAARAHIAELMHGQAAGTLPVLLFASSSRTFNAEGVCVHGEPPHWYLNVYTQSQIEKLSSGYAAHGASLIYDAQGLVLCIPQSQLAAELSGKTLDIAHRDVWIR